MRAQDPDGETVSYALRNAPDGMTIDNLGRIRWTPEAANAGVNTVEVIARDPRGAESIQSFNLMVSVDDVASDCSGGSQYSACWDWVNRSRSLSLLLMMWGLSNSP